MHHICNCVRLCFNKNKNTTLKIGQKKQKNKQKNILKHVFKLFNKKHKNIFFTSMVNTIKRSALYCSVPAFL